MEVQLIVGIVRFEDDKTKTNGERPKAYKPGEVLEVSKEVAESLISRGKAVALEAEAPQKKKRGRPRKVETAAEADGGPLADGSQ